MGIDVLRDCIVGEDVPISEVSNAEWVALLDKVGTVSKRITNE